MALCVPEEGSDLEELVAKAVAEDHRGGRAVVAGACLEQRCVGLCHVAVTESKDADNYDDDRRDNHRHEPYGLALLHFIGLKNRGVNQR